MSEFGNKCSVVLNDLFAVMKGENRRLSHDLTFEKRVNTVLQNMRNFSLQLIDDCKCRPNSSLRRKFLELNETYNQLISSQTLANPVANYKSSETDSASEGDSDQDIENKTDLINGSLVKSSSLTITHICGDCGQHFDSEHALTDHMKTFHNRFPNIQCFECNLFFESDIDLEVHFNRDHKQIDSFICHECQKVFDSRELFAKHLSEHNTKDPEVEAGHQLSESQVKSDIETKANKSREISAVTSLAEALKSITSPTGKSRPDFQCPKCPQSFQRKSCLERHMNRDHFNVRHICDECDEPRVFYTKTSLSEHLYKIHRIRDFTCGQCGHKCSSKRLLDTHVLTHALVVKKPFACDQNGCNKKFQTKSSLAGHKKTAHNSGVGPTPKTKTQSHRIPKTPIPSKPKKESDCTSKSQKTSKMKPKAKNSSEKVSKYFKNKEMKAKGKAKGQRGRPKLMKFACNWPDCHFRIDTYAKLNQHKRSENHSKNKI